AASLFSLLAARILCRFPFFFTHTPPTELCPLSLHDALPIYPSFSMLLFGISIAQSAPPFKSPCFPLYALLFMARCAAAAMSSARSEEHTSELQSRFDLVCRLLLETKKDSLGSCLVRR